MEIAYNKVTCPGCGANIEFKTTDSVLTVCTYCNTTVGKSENSIENHGIKSSVLKDYSKIKIGTMGNCFGEQFSVIGRVQIRYIYGFWNEWYILFSNGLTGWMSDIQNEYLITLEYSEKNNDFLRNKLNISSYKPIVDFNKFNEIEIDRGYKINESSYLAVDKSEANIEGSEGELNFNTSNKLMKVVDFKRSDLFVTADFTESETNPKFYFGKSIDESELTLSNIRTIEEINDATGEEKGKLVTFSCPSCGNSNPKVSGATNTVFCISCGSKLDVSTKVAQVLASGKNIEHKYETTLQCGKVGVLNNNKYIVIGVIVKEDEDNNRWIEYFLYQKHGHGLFLWLIEDLANGSWFISNVISKFPKYEKKGISYNDVEFKEIYESDYTGKVLSVWGSFNWEVSLDDEVLITDYKSSKDGNNLLISKEIIQSNTTLFHKEVTFSLNKKIAVQAILDGFKIDKANLVSTNDFKDGALENISSLTPKIFYILLFLGGLFLNFFISMFSGNIVINILEYLMSAMIVTIMGYYIENWINENMESSE